MSFRENINIALHAISSNMLRTIITSLIITIGITALVGMLTATDGIENGLVNTFSKMGSNTINIRNRDGNIRVGGHHERPIEYLPITYFQANTFKKNFPISSNISISADISYGATIKYENKKSNPNVSVHSIDENYLQLNGLKLSEGRNFTIHEANSGSKNCIVGKDIAELINKKQIIGEKISYNQIQYNIIGVLESKGSSMAMGNGGNRKVYITNTEAKGSFLNNDNTFNISIAVNNIQQLDLASNEAEGMMRGIRNLRISDSNNFSVVKSESFALKLKENLSGLKLVATLISIITLIGAAIGLMNIMLVSVTERTKEIGIRKALGATPRIIRIQFLTEAALICQIGGIAGILLGVIIGNSVGMAMGIGFTMPWLWIFIALIVCYVVGLAAGYYPAKRASKLDPIEALRYE